MIHVIFLSMNRYQLSSQKTKSKEEREKKKLVTIIKIKPQKFKQIVQTTESENKNATKESFLGEKNNTFDRQTVAKVVDKFREAKQSGNIAKKHKIQNSSAQNKKGSNRLAKLGLGLPSFSGKNLNPTDKISPADESIMKEIQSQTAANNDYVKDIPLADVTRFNTVEYRHYGFYQRIRNQLELHWGASLKDKAKKIYKSGRKISSDNDSITNIEVAIDKSGKITGTQYRDWETDRKSTRLNSSHLKLSRMPSSA